MIVEQFLIFVLYLIFFIIIMKNFYLKYFNKYILVYYNNGTGVTGRVCTICANTRTDCKICTDSVTCTQCFTLYLKTDMTGCVTNCTTSDNNGLNNNINYIFLNFIQFIPIAKKKKFIKNTKLKNNFKLYKIYLQYILFKAPKTWGDANNGAGLNKTCRNCYDNVASNMVFIYNIIQKYN